MKIVKRLFTVKLELTVKELADLILVLDNQRKKGISKDSTVNQIKETVQTVFE